MHTLKTPLAIVTILVGASVSAYITFANYKPNVKIANTMVKGLETVRAADLPLPQDAQLLSSDNQIFGRTLSIKTTLTGDDSQKFYRNILLSKGWKIESEGNIGIFANTKYKKGDDTIAITTSPQANSEYTIVTITLRGN
ncbi:MAG: hypothetical protein UX69_C0009G0005 [candidate division WWE3 bacterium GW2011_GWA2_46_9]|uniref:Uncharacterized protein n=1 Tax=candidate division WWE3 bacterium GW2011_GWA2_46_9 TaxID=1619111 RepID=A0A0G1TU17_UNCKA|nr:MAG: hypothetical protein UX69_C0009G0005 [candidate division WWE3 bacterium GW2011_GWA2_46_9]